jgi:WD40 repeat protein
VRLVVFSTDGARLLTGSEDSTLRVWDVASGAEEQVIRSAGSVVNALLLHDGSIAAVFEGNHFVRVWAPPSEHATATAAWLEHVSSVELLPGGSVASRF